MVSTKRISVDANGAGVIGNGHAVKAGRAKSEAKTFQIPAMNIRTFQVELIGTSPLICHKFGVKAEQEMLDKHMGKAKAAKEKKNPEQLFKDSIYWINEKKGECGFPASAFKAAAVRACSFVDGVSMTSAKGAFFVMASTADLVAISGKPTIRQDIVRVGNFGNKKPDVRFRAEFIDWKVGLIVRHNANVLTAEQIVNLFDTAGFSVGVGDWRPEKSGSNGMFKVLRHVELSE